MGSARRCMRTAPPAVSSRHHHTPLRPADIRTTRDAARPTPPPTCATNAECGTSGSRLALCVIPQLALLLHTLFLPPIAPISIFAPPLHLQDPYGTLCIVPTYVIVRTQFVLSPTRPRDCVSLRLTDATPERLACHIQQGSQIARRAQDAMWSPCLLSSFHYHMMSSTENHTNRLLGSNDMLFNSTMRSTRNLGNNCGPTPSLGVRIPATLSSRETSCFPDTPTTSPVTPSFRRGPLFSTYMDDSFLEEQGSMVSRQAS